MPGLLPNIDPDGLLEFSVVYTDRALNHMSKSFQGVMTDISRILKDVYKAHSVALVPGSGTYGMEAVARQFATDKPVLVIRNGWRAAAMRRRRRLHDLPRRTVRAGEVAPGGPHGGAAGGGAGPDWAGCAGR